MSLAVKMELENRIFARAAQVQSQVHSKYGGLFSPSEDLELQTLLYVYNAHFRAENWARFCSPGESLQGRQEYLAQGGSLANKTPVLHKKEITFELALSEEK